MQTIDDFLDGGEVKDFHVWMLLNGDHAQLYFTEASVELPLFDMTEDDIISKRGYRAHVVYHKENGQRVTGEYDIQWVGPLTIDFTNFNYRKFYCGRFSLALRRLQSLIWIAAPVSYLELLHDCLAYAKQVVSLLHKYCGARGLSVEEQSRLDRITITTGAGGTEHQSRRTVALGLLGASVRDPRNWVSLLCLALLLYIAYRVSS